MRQFENKKQIKSRFYSRLTIAGLLLVILILGNGVWNIYSKNRQSVKLRNEAESKLAATDIQRASLQWEIEKLQSEVGVEEEIRTKFNVVKPGEHVVMIVNPDASTTTATTSRGFFGTIKSWIGL